MVRNVYCSDRFAGDRRVAWQSVIRNVYANLDLDIGVQPDFFASINQWIFGSAELTEVIAEAEHARRTPRHIARASSESCIYLLVRKGALTVTQFGRTCVLGPGEFTFMDLDHPYVLSHDERIEKIGLKLPTELLRQRDSSLATHCAVGRSASKGIGRLAASFVTSLKEDLVSLPDGVGYGLAATAGDLFRLLIEGAEDEGLPSETAAQTALRRRAQAFITAHAGDCDLDPRGVADPLGVSVRYVHRCFEAAGTSCMEHLRETRLERCLADLGNPGLARLTVAEVAARNGFRNACHFSEAFRSRYGMTPRTARLRSASNGVRRQAVA
jgi:AraC-like DNA-binding protein